MAGGLSGKSSPKNYAQANTYSSEVLKNSQSDFLPQKPKLSFKGVLGLGQTVEINKPQTEKKSENIFFTNHLQQEQEAFLGQQQKQLTEELKQLREEIKKLVHATNNLEKDVIKASINPITDPSEYQLKFFTRIRIFIANFRKNISEAGNWVDAFSNKNKKKNAFWGKVKNKKQGGEQYLFSSEHSAARSVS